MYILTFQIFSHKKKTNEYLGNKRASLGIVSDNLDTLNRLQLSLLMFLLFSIDLIDLYNF